MDVVCLCGIRPIPSSSEYVPVIIMNVVMVVVSFAGASNILNDIYDINIDKKNKPHRPLPSGEISVWMALVYMLSIYFLGIYLLFNLYELAIEIALVIVLPILVLYTPIFKRIPLVGNMAVATVLGIVFLFSDDILINEINFLSALIIFIASTFYVIGGLLTLKISNKKNENVTASILIWGTLVLLPFTLFIEQPWHLRPRLDSTISLIYLGIFSTGIAWLLRFYILKHNGLVFQAQVAYLIPIFGVILGFVFLHEAITPKVIISLIAVIIGIYIVKKGSKIKIV